MNPQVLWMVWSWIKSRRKWTGLIFIMVFMLFSVRGLLHAVVNKTLSAAIGLPVKLERLYVKPFPLELGVYGVELGNPPGFETPRLAAMPELFIRIEPLDFLKGKIHIRQIRFHLEEINVERNAEGKINLQEAGKKVSPGKKTPEPGPAPAPGPTRTPSGKKAPELQIDEVIFSLGSARYVETGKQDGMEKTIQLNIKNMVLQDVTDPFALTQQVLKVILEKMAALAVGIQFDNLRENLQLKAQETVAGTIQAVSDWARKLHS